MSSSSPLAIVVHGGAWSIPSRELDAHRAGVAAAAEAGWQVLDAGGSALDAVEAAIARLEDDPVFNAGAGSNLNRDGRVQMDALLMEGAQLRAGAVAAVERVANPIRLARQILERDPHLYYAGAAAEARAQALGFALCAPEALVTPAQRQRWLEARAAGAPAEFESAPLPVRGQAIDALPAGDTVGAVALDAAGHLAAGTSTGGTFFKLPGRIGDSSLPGCGGYADDELAAVSTTGWGESIMRVTLARLAADFSRHLPARAAAEAAIAHLARRVGGYGGLILLRPGAEIGIAWNTRQMARAWRRSGMHSARAAV